MEDIIKKLNILLSDLQVQRANLQGMHWSMKGSPGFLTFHKYFDELYAETGNHIDAIAEFVVIYRNKPVVSLSKYVRRSSLEEVTQESDFSIKACIDKAYVDNSIIIPCIKELFDLTSNQLDIGDYMAVMLSDYGKRQWFLRASMWNEPEDEDEQEEEKEEDSEESPVED